MENGIVSLIIPCYNGETYLKRTIECVLEQSYHTKIELIFVNDGSTDKSQGIVSLYEKRLKEELFDYIYVDQKNAGVGAAVNTALKHFTGEFIALLDVDDYMMPKSIEEKANWLIQNPEYSVVFSNGYYVTEQNFYSTEQKFYINNPINNDSLFWDIIDGKIVNWSGSYMIRSDIWIKRCPDREIYPSRAGQNMQMILPAVYKEKAGYIDEPLMRYLMQEQSLSHFKKDVKGVKNFLTIYQYQDIYENVIGNICDDSEKEMLLKRVAASAARTRFGIAIESKNCDKAQIAFSELRKGGYVKLNDAIQYYGMINHPIQLVLKIIRRIIMIKKVFVVL